MAVRLGWNCYKVLAFECILSYVFFIEVYNTGSRPVKHPQ